MKKIVLLLALILSLSLFISCEPQPYPAHEHKYEKVSYSVTENDEVVKNYICACGDIKTEVVEGAVVAKPENAQEKLDALKSGETLFFSDGEYERLAIRNAKGNSSYYGNAQKTQKLEWEQLKESGVYWYERELVNVTLIASENAVLKGISLATGHAYEVKGDEIDPVRGVKLQSTNTSYYADLRISGLTIDGLKFAGEGSKGFLAFNIYTTDSYLHDLVIRNCVFKGTKKDDGFGGIRLTYSNG